MQTRLSPRLDNLTASAQFQPDRGGPLDQNRVESQMARRDPALMALVRSS